METNQKYVLQRIDDNRYLTPEYLVWDADKAKAQICEKDEAHDIRHWLAGIGINVAIVQN